MLDSTEFILPVGSDERKRVLTMCNGRWENMERKEVGLCRKLNKLHSSNTPKGDPFVPLEVTRAKDLRQRILAKIRMNDFDHDTLDF